MHTCMSQSHACFNVVKCNLSKVKLEAMWSAVSPIWVHVLRGDLRDSQLTSWFGSTLLALVADLCGS